MSLMTRVTRKTRNQVSRWLLRLFIIAICAPYIIPLLWMLSTALKTSEQVVAFPPEWIPRPVAVRNFVLAVTKIDFVTYLTNTVIVVAFSVVGTLISCVLCAYGFSKLQWKGRETLFYITIATMMLPFPATLIPTFLIFARIGLINTLTSLWILQFLGSPYFIFLLRQFYRTVPNAYLDAARIDGMPELRIVVQIMIPLTIPVLAVIGLFQFLESWNDFLRPLLYLMEESKYTLALGLQEFRTTMGTGSWTEWNLFMAASALTVLPTIVIFFFSQRLLIEGITITGIKG